MNADSKVWFNGLCQNPVTMLRFDSGMQTKALAKALESSDLVLPGDRGRVLAVGEDIAKGLAMTDGDQFGVPVE